MSFCGVHLVGSVPLHNAVEVFQITSAVLGRRLARIPDGETGERAGWMGWLGSDFASHPDLEPSDETFRPHAAGHETLRYRLKPSARRKEVEFPNLRHAEVAIRIYGIFRELKAAGKIPAHCRYQFAIAHPISVANHYAAAAEQDIIERAYERGLMQQIDKMLAVIPAGQFAVQWDLGSAVFAPLQTAAPTRHGATKEEMLETICKSCIRIGNALPNEVELLYHLCYGDSGHRHAVEPADMGDMVDVASRVTATIRRPIRLFHMPVPRDRSDDGYFQPLARLVLQPSARISLGLIHMTDGLEGAARRLAAARRYLSDFLVATECGFGRRPVQTIPALLDLHAKVADLADHPLVG